MSALRFALALLLAAPAGDVRAEGSPTTTRRDVTHVPAQTSGHLPVTTTLQPSLLCYPDATGMRCPVDTLGAGVTQGTGTGFEPSSYVPEIGGTPRYGARIDTNAKAPRLTTQAVIENVWPASHTMVIVAAPGGAAAISGLFADYGYGTYGFRAYGSSTAVGCQWHSTGGAGAGVKTAAVSMVGQAARALVVICEWDAATKVGTAWVNGNSVAAAAWDVQPAASTGGTAWLGMDQSGMFPLAGVLHLLALYEGKLSAEEKLRTAALWDGSHGDDRPVFDNRDGTACWEAPDGYVRCKADDSARCDERGCLSEDARTNYWIDSSDASLWGQAVGEPMSVTVNQANGPLSYLLGAPEADLLTDDSITAAEGLISSSAHASGATAYTQACYLKAGTTDKIFMRFSVSGPGTTGHGTACTHTLTESFARYTCGVSTSVAPTNITGSLRVGALSAGDEARTGDFLMSHCQLEPNTSPSQPIPTGPAPITRLADVLTVSTAGWPVQAGEIEITYEPTATRTAGGYDYIIDTRPAGGSTSEGVRSYIDPTGALITYVGSAAAVTGATSGALTWTVRTRYKLLIKWGGGNLWVWRNNVLIASSLSGAGTMPTGHPHGSIGGTFLQADGWLSLDAVRR